MYGDPYCTWETIWNWLTNDHNVLSNIVNIISITIVLKQIFDFFTKFRKKVKIPVSNSAFVDYILKRNYWTSKELATLYNIDKENSKQLLKFLGYTWDNKEQVYTISNEKKKDIKDKINKLDKQVEMYAIENINQINP